MTLGRAQLQGKKKVAGVSVVLWLLFLVSVGLLGVVRVQVHKSESAWTEPSVARAAAPEIATQSPEGWVRASALRLSWQPVLDAYLYKLRITTITGRVIVDELPVEANAWMPPEEMLPALTPGEYLWEVRAVDPRDYCIARSAPASFEVLN